MGYVRGGVFWMGYGGVLCVGGLLFYVCVFGVVVEGCGGDV